MTVAKFATSIPPEQFAALERARRKLKLNRSEAIQQALNLWLKAHLEDARAETYVRAYLARPEDKAEGRAFVQAWAGGQSEEEW